MCPDKTTSTDARRKNTIVVKTQARKAKCLDFICSSATNFLDDRSQVNQVRFFQAESVPSLQMHEAHIAFQDFVQKSKKRKAAKKCCRLYAAPVSPGKG